MGEIRQQRRGRRNSSDKLGRGWYEQGYDIELYQKMSKNVDVPIIASGGAGSLEDILEVLTEGTADAALVASLFHFGTYTIDDVKGYLRENGVVVR